MRKMKSFLPLLTFTFMSTISAFGFAHSSVEHGIKVSANGSSFISPEIVKLHLSFEHTAKNATDARSKTSENVASLIESLERFSIDDATLDSGQISIAPMYSYHDGARRLEGYQATRFVKFTLLELSELEELVKAITSSDVSRLNNLRFDVRDQTDARAQALKDAIEKTKSAASTIANTYGKALGEIRFVEHNVEQTAHPMATRMRAMSAESSALNETKADSYQIQDIEFKARVTATFEFD